MDNAKYMRSWSPAYQEWRATAAGKQKHRQTMLKKEEYHRMLRLGLGLGSYVNAKD